MSHETASQARFQALKRRFETPPKMEENGPSHRVAVKRQRLFRTLSSQSATDCPPASISSKDPPKNMTVAPPLKVTETRPPITSRRTSCTVYIVHRHFNGLLRSRPFKATVDGKLRSHKYSEVPCFS